MRRSCSLRSEYEVARDDNADGPAGADPDRGLDAEITFDDALSGLINGVGCAPADGAFDIAVAVTSQFSADTKDRRETSCDEHPVPVMICSVREACIALRVCAGRGNGD